MNLDAELRGESKCFYLACDKRETADQCGATEEKYV